MTSTASSTTTSRRAFSSAFALALLLLCGSASRALWGQATEPAVLLRNLRDSTSLYRKGVQAWELKLSFVLNDFGGKPQDNGTLSVQWQPMPDRSLGKTVTDVQSKFIQGPLSQAQDKKDPKALREAILLQKLIKETVDPIDVYQTDGLEVKQQSRKFGNVELSCLRVSPESNSFSVTSQAPTFCFQPDMPNVLRARLTTTENSLRNRVGKFQNTNLTLDNKLFYNGLIAISGKTESLKIITDEQSVAPPTSASADPPDGEPSFAIAGGVIAGHKISGANVVYPVEARMAHESGSVVISAIIDKTGHIGRLVPIASPSGSLTAAAMDAVKTYVYKPYLLNGQPTEVDTTITVNFSLRNDT